MTCQDNEILLNNVLIAMARSFLQYASESWPWVSTETGSVDQQVQIIAARQRQDVSEIVDLLVKREHFIDFGSYPTEYTDLQFLSLQSAMVRIHNSQQHVLRRLADASVSLRAAGDTEAADLLANIEGHERDATRILDELRVELDKLSSAAG